ncbi:hypothetical protein U9M48_029453 [Paspalum notatum var. saurae]|uniref:Integrase catalytic domain-containing protein n=1 Tax=Paspalum notatum var. saurae TaxID=547442 RepID=A0AAQ3U309_PASNO
MVHNLLSIRQFTADNSCTVEFDSSGLTVKDLASRRPLLRCDSAGPLYTLRFPTSAASPSTSSPSAAFVATTSSTTWHRRLGHPGRDVLAQLSRSADLPCTRAPDEHLCHACQLGRHVRLPFSTSSHADCIFDLVHCDVWTSPVLSISGYKYYLVVVDDFSHYSWTFPLRFKSEAFSTLSHFFAWVSTQFGLTIKAVQCDNGREFDNNASRSFFLTRGVQLRMSCPYTSAQNGKAERMIRTTNDVMRTLLFQASLPARFWAESLHTATYLLNRLPSTASPAPTPHHALFGTPPRYNHLRVFGCACYPNTSATAPHKLAPRSTRCVFLGYSPDHKGYRCFDLTSRRILISWHVVFDESDFPFSSTTTPASDLELESPFPTDPMVQPPLYERSAGPPLVCLPDAPAPLPVVPAAPRAAPESPAAPCAAPSSSAAPCAAQEAPSSPVAPRAALEAPSSPAAPRAAPVPPLRYAQPVRVFQRRAAVSSAPAPSPPVSSVPAPSSSPPAEPPRRPRLASRVASTVYHPPVLERDPRHLHPMVTRRAAGILRPAALSATAAEPGISPVPSSVRDALADPHLRRAMEEKYAALLANQTWDLVPPPPGGNVVTGKWIWTHKRRADGTLDRYKARWVLRGFTQRPGVDYDETFSPVVKLLRCAHRPLAGSFSFMARAPSGCQECLPSWHLDRDESCAASRRVLGIPLAQRWLLGLGIFGLPRSWSLWGSLRPSQDTSLHGDETAYLLLYVDDIVLTASSQHLLQRIITSLQQDFAMKDLGVLHHFLGVTVEPRSSGLLLHQRQYTLDILERARMTDCNPCSTPVDTQTKLSEDAGPPVADPTAYRSLAGALQYLTFTRPDITYAVQQVCLHMHDPREPHLTALKPLLRYLRGTVDYGLLLHRSSSADLVVYTDADWAGCPDTRRSTSGYTVFLGGNLVSWSSKWQPVVSRSSAEAEYRAVANGVAEASWLRQLLTKLHSPLAKSTLVYCDNVSAVYLSTNPVQHQRTKHVEIDLHFVRDRVAIGDVRVLHVPTTSQFADIFTKGLPSRDLLRVPFLLNIARG